MLTLTRRIDHAPRVHGVLALPWAGRASGRLQAPLASGERVALRLQPDCAAPLRHGDLLRGDDGRVVRIVAAPEPTYALRCPDPLTLARCALFLGGCRIQAQACHWGLRIRAAPALRALFDALGAAVHEELAPFEPELLRHPGPVA